ncbi:hypothetical protein HN873_071732, partial [Arachis hypogaea]
MPVVPLLDDKYGQRLGLFVHFFLVEITCCPTHKHVKMLENKNHYTNVKSMSWIRNRALAISIGFFSHILLSSFGGDNICTPTSKKTLLISQQVPPKLHPLNFSPFEPTFDGDNIYTPTSKMTLQLIGTRFRGNFSGRAMVSTESSLKLLQPGRGSSECTYYLVEYTKQSYHNKNATKARQLITQYRVSSLIVNAVIDEIET